MLIKISTEHCAIRSIAREFDMSERSVYRYIKILENAGIGIEVDFHNKLFLAQDMCPLCNVPVKSPVEGEWMIADNGVDDKYNYTILLNGSKAVCDVYRHNWPNKKEDPDEAGLAHAKLIQSSPVLLKAALSVLQQVDLCNYMDTEDHDLKNNKAIHDLRNAVNQIQQS